MERGGTRLVAVVLALLWLAGCQALTDQIPTTPTKATPAPVPLAIPVTGIPVPALTSPALTSPAPATPTPAPTPAPTPTPAPGGSSCRLPASNPANPVCTDDGQRLLSAVDAALTAVTQKRPELFRFNDTRCDNCYYVKDISAFIGEVERQLAKQGLCMAGGAEEIGVKNSNDYSEQYDILLASGHMRRGLGSYRGVCRPAIF